MKRTQRIVRAESGKKLALSGLAATAALALAVGNAATITIATLNNPDVIELKKLSPAFEKANPDIKLNWVILKENVLRQRAASARHDRHHHQQRSST